MSPTEPILDGVRRETKYFVPPDVRTAIRHDLERLMDRDAHQASDFTGYEVSTLYFDTPRRTQYIEKIEGVPLRFRFRIRQYGNQSDVRRLEMKERIFDHHRKQRVSLTPDEYDAVVSGRHVESHDPVLRAFWAHRARLGLAPCLITRYVRQAYTGRADRSVRVTLDSGLHAQRALRFEDDRWIPARALPHGTTILELKWTTAFPFWMQFLVRKYSLRNFAISKYCLAMDALMARGSVSRV